MLAPILFYDDSDIANLVSFDYTCNHFDTRTVFEFCKVEFSKKNIWADEMQQYPFNCINATFKDYYILIRLLDKLLF